MIIFSPESNVTLVVTSCGRFPLLKKTLESFDEYNTFPIKEVIITEDSGSDAIHDIIPSHWKAHCKIIINQPKLGQTLSVDLAYSQVTTPYIFHCEDDWEFYRPNFLNDSMELLKSDSKILQVWLRSFHYDISQHYNFISLGTYNRTNNIGYYHVHNNNKKQCGFSYNPGLRRLADYKKIAPYSQYDLHEEGTESGIAEAYQQHNMFAVILENDAVTHTGWGQHVSTQTELKKFQRRKKIRMIRNIALFVTGVIIGYVIA